MADKKISALTGATTPLAGTEVLPIVQGGSTVKVSIANVTAGRATAVGSLASSGTVSATGSAEGANFSGLQVDNASAGSGSPANTVSLNFANFSVVKGRITAAVYGDGYMDFATDNDTPKMRITAGGGIINNLGNFVLGTAGKGIDFSANTHAAGMTSELLNWYEEGAWTPSVGGNATYTIQEGLYVRVGDLVYVQCQLLLNVIGTGSTTTISGLPFQAFSPSNSSRGTGSVWYCGNLATGVTMLTPGVTPAGQTITFGGFTVLGAGTTMTVPLTVFQNGTRVDFSLVYRAN
jgi:hypothetical protein